jgi:hypothetical protein
MARLDMPGVEIEWHEDGVYTLPDSSNMLKFNLSITNPVKFLGWYIKKEWRNLTWYGRALVLYVWFINWIKRYGPYS